ncbi:PREDICTED: polymeric immunoglobulin receptor [Mesitornis unicolor]|uniref:polymeric immunoglobulin receptor n=1 Tax=Mesitornis unicolor TaxID=54374 RepID=UPI0005281B61|nr:PREDICTED: polymeric immunoglobulin receptor [Mesitornis unicolor]
MTLLVLIFLLTCLSAESASSRYPPKSSSNPVFGPRQVYGLLNGSVTVKCFYPPTSVNRHDRKYWCRESAMGCMTVVSTNGYTAPGYQGRASITNYPQAENFQIDISGLTMADKGTYQCGIGINGRGLSHKVSLEVSEAPHVPEGAELFHVELHSTLTTSCSFGEKYVSERKFLCKMEKNGCRNIIDSYGKIDDDYTGRVLLSNKEPPGSFSIVITQMGWEDSGLYLCGVGVHGETGETKELDVHVYEVSSVPQGKPTIIGVKGSSVTFECRYEPQKETSEKQWCKWRNDGKGCTNIINTSGYVSPLYEGRVAMYDNPGNKTITVILNQLQNDDSGYYWCMTGDEKEQQSSTELKIIEGEPGLEGKKDVEAQVGSRVDLTCSYPCKYYSYQKYWCKWTSTGCTPMPASDQQQPGPDVTCDTDNKTVVLSFSEVAMADQGWYWCGVKRDGRYRETMAVYLWVREGKGDNRSPDLLDVDDSSHAEPPSHADEGFVPRERAYSDAGVQSAAASESSDQSHSPSTIALVLGPVGAVLLILVTAFAAFKYRQLKRSDLVSIGSYRTNISMSDFESMKGYSASNNACVKENQETQLGGDEFITTTAAPESAAETKKAKRSSKEDADLAYSAFLLTSGSITQGGAGGGSTTPAEHPPNWEGQI